MAIERGHSRNEQLLIAVVRGELTTVRRLLERNSADINYKNKVGLSCLQLAIVHRHFRLASYLIRRGVDLLWRDSQGWNALHDAALMDNRALAQKLISKGCSPTMTTDKGELPIDVAGSTAMERLLCHAMELRGESKLAQQYRVYLGLGDTELQSYQPLFTPRNHKNTPTTSGKLFDDEPASPQRLLKTNEVNHTWGRRFQAPTSDLEVGTSNYGIGGLQGSQAKDEEVKSHSRLQEAVIDLPPTHEFRFRPREANSINSLPQRNCVLSYQISRERDLVSYHSAASSRTRVCFDSSALRADREKKATFERSSTESPKSRRRKVSFAECPMAKTQVALSTRSAEIRERGRSSSEGNIRLSSQVFAHLNEIYEDSCSRSDPEDFDPVGAVAMLKMKPRKSSIAKRDCPSRRNSDNNGRRRSVSFQPEVLLQEIVTDGDVKLVHEVLKSGVIPDVNKISPAGLTALHQSALDGNLQCAKALVSNGANVNCVDVEKWTPLHAAAVSGHLELVRFLLESGANPTLKDEQGETPYDVAKSGPIRKMLLCKMNGKSPDTDDFSDGEYYGEEEEEYSHAESDSDDEHPSACYFESNEKKPSLKERLGLNHSSALKNSRDSSVSPSPDLETSDNVFTSKSPETCITHKRERESTDSTSSCGSFFEPELERIKELDGENDKHVSSRTVPTATEDLNYSDTDKISEDQGISTMEGSSDCSHRRDTLSDDEGTSRDVIDSDLKHGSLDYKFQEAVLCCDVDAILKLARHKHEIDVNRMNKTTGITALHHAVLEENFALVQHLVKDFEASVHIQDTDGWTPLHAASAVGNIRIAQFLLESGAKASVLNNSCEFPVDVAEDKAMEKFLKNVMLGPSVGKLFKGIFT